MKANYCSKCGRKLTASTKWVPVTDLIKEDTIQTELYGYVDYGMYFVHQYNSVQDFLLAPYANAASKYEKNKKRKKSGNRNDVARLAKSLGIPEDELRYTMEDMGMDEGSIMFFGSSLTKKKFLTDMWKIKDVRLLAAAYYIISFIGIDKISSEAKTKIEKMVNRCSLNEITYKVYNIIDQDPAMYNSDAPYPMPR